MSRKQPQTILSACIIERLDNHLLIALPMGQPEDNRYWVFPRDSAKDGETPEQAMRRIAKDQLNLEIEIVVGQPPLPVEHEGQPAQVRYFFCGIIEGEATPGPYEKILWIPKAHLAEYDFDRISQPVAEFLLEENRR